jgi:hypothetical protein
MSIRYGSCLFFKCGRKNGYSQRPEQVGDASSRSETSPKILIVSGILLG